MEKLTDYIDIIARLPFKDSYHVDDIVTDDFLIARDGSLEIYYCTHNEYINTKAKLFIIGITPGFQQMSKSIAVARKCVEEKIPIADIPYICKRESRFFGPMRKNIIQMLDDLGLDQHLQLESSVDLFDERDELLHTTSVIPFAVFKNGKNYTGSSPKILKNNLLSYYVSQYFLPQASTLSNSLFIPLGKSVEEVLREYCKRGLLKEENILPGFPHPSGADGHRVRQFNENKQNMKNIISEFFNRDL
jgi:hypothetical protein